MWTDPDKMRLWMCPRAAKVAYLELNPVIGGRYRIDMTMGEHGVISQEGEFIDIRRPERLVFTWRSQAMPGENTLVTVELRDVDGGCELTLTHEKLPNDWSVDIHRGGWADILLHLAETL